MARQRTHTQLRQDRKINFSSSDIFENGIEIIRTNCSKLMIFLFHTVSILLL